MKKWELTFPIVGAFDFSGDFEIAEITFSENKTRKEYEAKMIIEAENRKNATKMAQEKIGNILDVISFVREVGFEMGYPFVFQKDSKEMVQVTRSVEIPIITEVHKKIIKRVYENLKPTFKDEGILSEKMNRALLALRWYRKGCFFNNPTDKFLAFWFAVESLAGEKSKSKRRLPFNLERCKNCVTQSGLDGNDLMSQVIGNIHEAYRPIPDVITENITDILKIEDSDEIEEIRAKIKKMQKDRSGIVHKGNVQIDVTVHNEYLKQLMEKLLREKLDIAFDSFINSWPTAELRENSSEDHLEIEAIKYVLSMHPRGATIDEIEYGLFSLTKRIRRPKDLHAKLEVLIRNDGDIRTRKINNEGRYFLISD